MRNYVSFWTAVGLLSSVLAFAGYAHAGEQQTVKALSAWQGMGATFQVDEKEALVIGALGGMMFIDGAKGSLDAASLICPATVSINLVNGERDAEGRCIITDEDCSRRKPSPDPYLRAMELLGATAARSVAVEDSRRGLTSATTAGLRCFIVRSEFMTRSDFDGAHAVLDHIRDLPPALAI